MWIGNGAGSGRLFTEAVDEWSSATVTFLVLVGLAFALGPMVPVFCGVLDGSLLPRRVQDRLRHRHVLTARKARRERKEANLRLAAIERLSNDMPRLWEARSAGIRLGALTDRSLIDAAQQAVDEVAHLHGKVTEPSPERLKGAIDSMAAALGANSVALSDQLGMSHRELVTILQDWRYEASTLASTHAALYAARDLDRPQVTRFGDARLITEQRCLDIYGIDFTFLWPRLRAHLASDTTESERLVDAQALVDFAVLTLALALTVPILWLPAILFRTEPVSAMVAQFVLVGGGTAFLVRCLYDLAVQNQFALAATVKATIDRHRFRVLSDLRQSLPTTLSDERTMWTNLRNIEARAEGELTYDHSTGTESAG